MICRVYTSMSALTKFGVKILNISQSSCNLETKVSGLKSTKSSF